MTEFWEAAFAKMQMMWGQAPTASAVLVADHFARAGVKDVLIPGIGYGRNAKAFLDRSMLVTGIEISETAIALARTQLHLEVPIFHGSVENMPYDSKQYQGIFCFGLLYLLDLQARAKFLQNCHHQLAPSGYMVFTVIAKDAPMYGLGPKLSEDCYERLPGLPMFFYDETSVQREFGPYGLVEFSKINEPLHDGTSLPFIQVVCQKNQVP
jgi:SAM-dependent methyltransferase